MQKKKKKKKIFCIFFAKKKSNNAKFSIDFDENTNNSYIVR